AGEAFQVVLSQRFEMDTDADPLDVYRILRTTNPSPYMYLLRPYFWVYDASVEVAALVGPARRRFPYETLELDGNKLYAVQGDGKRRKVSVSKWMANGDDWAQFTAPLQRPDPRCSVPPNAGSPPSRRTATATVPSRASSSSPRAQSNSTSPRCTAS
ncbi:chorismate-binding protein, partial [Kibdelosporangium lantanae]